MILKRDLIPCSYHLKVLRWQPSSRDMIRIEMERLGLVILLMHSVHWMSMLLRICRQDLLIIFTRICLEITILQRRQWVYSGVLGELISVLR